MRKLLLILPLVLLGLWGCEHVKGHFHNHDAAHEVSQVAGTTALPQGQDNGMRWKANRETTAGILSMRQRAQEFQSTGVSQADWQSLAEEMTTDLNGIFDKCTMKGEAHEQLHGFLLPLAENIKTIKAGGAGAETALQSMKDRLNSYERYFE